MLPGQPPLFYDVFSPDYLTLLYCLIPVCVFVQACGSCCRGQKERKGGEDEEVYSYGSRVHLGGRQSAGVGIRYKLVQAL